MNLANNLTILRILLVPALILSLIYYSPERSYLANLSLAAFFIACLTDALDGYVARRFNQKTVLGSYLDPIADKLLLLSVFISLSFMNNLPVAMRIPAWVTIVVITRDILIILGFVMIFLTTGRLKAEPLFTGKLTTVLQMAALMVSLLSAPLWLRYVFYVSTAALTAVSGLFYLRLGGRILQAPV